jgi:choline monooxygenase
MTDLPLPDLNEETLAIQPLACAETIPSSWYTDPRFHPFERDALLARSWQFAGHEAQLSEPGTYLSTVVAGNPVVVVRGKDDVTRAFYNVCRHRGGPLVTDSCGRTGVLKCQYHGWTYQLDGVLRGVPRFDRTELFDKRDFGLLPVRLACWQGLLFIVLDGDPPPLGEVLDGIAERIAPLRLDALRYYGRETYEVACNWKVYVDNYLEGYHVPLVHPELTKRLDYRSYTTETAPWYSLQHSGFRADGNGLYAGADQAAYYYFVFPNMMINILPGRMQTNVVEPLAPDRCRVRFDYFYEDVDSEEARRAIAEDVAFSDRVQREDVDICEHVQRGLSSRAYDRGRFSVEMERGVYHFQCLLKETYRRTLASHR